MKWNRICAMIQKQYNEKEITSIQFVWLLDNTGWLSSLIRIIISKYSMIDNDLYRCKTI